MSCEHVCPLCLKGSKVLTCDELDLRDGRDSLVAVWDSTLLALCRLLMSFATRWFSHVVSFTHCRLFLAALFHVLRLFPSALRMHAMLSTKGHVCNRIMIFS